MNGKRTPGPWSLHIERFVRDGEYFLIIGPSLDPDLKIEPLAEITFCSEADARLMVAAPELLNAAKIAFEAIKALSINQTNRNMIKDVMTESTLKTIEAAMEKAEPK